MMVVVLVCWLVLCGGNAGAGRCPPCSISYYNDANSNTKRIKEWTHISLSLIQNDITMQLRIMSTILAFSITEQYHHSVPINICTI